MSHMSNLVIFIFDLPCFKLFGNVFLELLLSLKDLHDDVPVTGMLLGRDLILSLFPIVLEVSSDATVDFCKFGINLLLEVVEDVREHLLVFTGHHIDNELVSFLRVVLHHLVLILIGLNTSHKTFSFSDALFFQLLIEERNLDGDVLE